MVRYDRVIAYAGWLCLVLDMILALVLARIEIFIPMLFAGVGLLYLSLPFRKLVIEKNPGLVRYGRSVRLSMFLLSLGIVASLLDTTLTFVFSGLGPVFLLVGAFLLIIGTMLWLSVLVKKRRSPTA